LEWVELRLERLELRLLVFQLRVGVQLVFGPQLGRIGIEWIGFRRGRSGHKQ
jgi:hypothetical protein